MRREYEIFEKFPDGSTLWRTCVFGKYDAQRKMQELREHSENEFFTLDVQPSFLPPKEARAYRPRATAAAG